MCKQRNLSLTARFGVEEMRGLGPVYTRKCAAVPSGCENYRPLADLPQPIISLFSPTLECPYVL